MNFLAGLAAALLLSLASCASDPSRWSRLDGSPIYPQQFETDSTICRGEKQKAALAGGIESDLLQTATQRRQQVDVFVGCMAQRGYTAAR